MKKQTGFTLIETLIAMAIFSIGILALFGMQAAAIKENLVANSITTGSAMAADRVERIISLDYDDPSLSVKGSCQDFTTTEDILKDGYIEDLIGFRDIVDYPISGTPEYTENKENIYKVYWNVSDDCTLIALPAAQKPKHVQIIVTRDTGDEKRPEKAVAIFHYIKQNN